MSAGEIHEFAIKGKFAKDPSGQEVFTVSGTTVKLEREAGNFFKWLIGKQHHLRVYDGEKIHNICVNAEASRKLLESYNIEATTHLGRAVSSLLAGLSGDSSHVVSSDDIKSAVKKGIHAPATPLLRKANEAETNLFEFVEPRIIFTIDKDRLKEFNLDLPKSLSTVWRDDQVEDVWTKLVEANFDSKIRYPANATQDEVTFIAEFIKRQKKARESVSPYVPPTILMGGEEEAIERESKEGWESFEDIEKDVEKKLKLQEKQAFTLPKTKGGQRKEMPSEPTDSTPLLKQGRGPSYSVEDKAQIAKDLKAFSAPSEARPYEFPAYPEEPPMEPMSIPGYSSSTVATTPLHLDNLGDFKKAEHEEKIRWIKDQLAAVGAHGIFGTIFGALELEKDIDRYKNNLNQLHDILVEHRNAVQSGQARSGDQACLDRVNQLTNSDRMHLLKEMQNLQLELKRQLKTAGYETNLEPIFRQINEDRKVYADEETDGLSNVQRAVNTLTELKKTIIGFIASLSGSSKTHEEYQNDLISTLKEFSSRLKERNKQDETNRRTITGSGEDSLGLFVSEKKGAARGDISPEEQKFNEQIEHLYGEVLFSQMNEEKRVKLRDVLQKAKELSITINTKEDLIFQNRMLTQGKQVFPDGLQAAAQQAFRDNLLSTANFYDKLEGLPEQSSQERSQDPRLSSGERIFWAYYAAAEKASPQTPQ